MEPRLTVLGVNAAHDASACILVDGRLVAAIAEERLTRVRHHAGFPYHASKYCLAVARIKSINDLDCIVLNQAPSSTRFDSELVFGGFTGTLLTNPSHHLLHAYYAWVASNFQETAIMIVDGSGYSFDEHRSRNSPLLGTAPPDSAMAEAMSTYVAHGQCIELVEKTWARWGPSDDYLRFPSLGHMYSMASQYIFGHWKYAGKTMGLASYGDPTSFPEPFIEADGSQVIVRTDWPLTLPPRSELPAHRDKTCCDVAAKVQSELERAMLHIASQLQEQTGLRQLCISGGVGLNSVTNGRILRELNYSDLYVTPAAGDSGVSVGAAFYGHHILTGELPVRPRRTDFLGRRYTGKEIDLELKNRSHLISCESNSNDVSHAASDIANGRIVAWFEGRSELGPRALGNRSILCDPRSVEMRDHLNEQVKMREPFRPFAASVLAEHVHEYFDMPCEDPFMLIVAPIWPHCRDEIAGVCHVDNTCRVQTVSNEHEGQLRGLIEAFKKITGLPLLLNTSFNIKGRPIVETPGDALDCFLQSNMDVLYIHGRRVTRKLEGSQHR
ncbi:carbamoyltransferase family protein [Novipirellula sp. SH528]|uniref:carbamoyltransferase family protein n=1 Tax=Novipirellula sp. SH528 TaxID=3454466 RepID=UPI003FA12934